MKKARNIRKEFKLKRNKITSSTNRINKPRNVTNTALVMVALYGCSKNQTFPSGTNLIPVMKIKDDADEIKGI